MKIIKPILLVLAVSFLFIGISYGNDSDKIGSNLSEIQFKLYHKGELLGDMYITSPQADEKLWRQVITQIDDKIVIHFMNNNLYIPKGTTLVDLVNSLKNAPGALGQFNRAKLLTVCRYYSKESQPVIQFAYNSTKPFCEYDGTDYIFTGKEIINFVLE